MMTWKNKLLPQALQLQLWLLPLAVVLPWIMASTLFFIPLGSTLKSIAIPLALISVLLVPSKRYCLLALVRKPWCVLALCLVGYLCVASIWSPAAFHNKWDIMSKYLKILFLPILAAGFSSKKSRVLAQQAFIIAMLITAACSFYYAYVIMVSLENDVAGSIFRNHIMTSLMMALACFISLNFAFDSKNNARYIYFIASFIMTWQIFFINQGRVGYLAYLIMLGIFLLAKCSIKQIVIAVGIVIAFGVGAYHYSPVLQLRVQETVSNIQSFREGNMDTSIGYRYLFHKYAYKKFNQKPIVGHGSGSFTYLYAQDKPVKTWDRPLLEPHSQYWLIAVEQGALGLVFLLLFYASLLWESRKMIETRLAFYMLFCTFILGSLTDSLLLYSGTGYLFITFTALCLGETVTFSKKIQPSHKS